MERTFKATHDYAIRLNTHFVNLGGGSYDLRRGIEIYYRIADRYGMLDGDYMDDDLDQFFRDLDHKRLYINVSLYKPRFTLPFDTITMPADAMPIARLAIA